MQTKMLGGSQIQIPRASVGHRYTDLEVGWVTDTQT